LDGWWAEAYSAEVGWALGDGREHPEPAWDATEAEALYEVLETQIVPTFYARDAQGIPRAWIARMRASMAHLTPQFSSHRMLREYVERLYLQAAAATRRRGAQGGQLARALHAWQRQLEAHWHEVHFGELQVNQDNDHWVVHVQVYLGEVSPQAVRVELYADPLEDAAPLREVMAQGEPIPGALHGYV